MLCTDPFGFAVVVDLTLCVGVAEDDLAIRLERATTSGSRVVVAFAVRDRNPQHLSAAAAVVNGVSVCSTRMWTCSQWNFSASVPQHRARQQAGLEQNLKAVADAEHRPARVRERLHLRA